MQNDSPHIDDQRIQQDAIHALTSQWEYTAAQRHRAAQALSRFNSYEAVSTLLDALTDTDTTVRRAALLSLIKIGPVAEDWLLDALRDKKPLIRRGAAQVLGELESENAVRLLIRRARRDKDWSVRTTSVIALGQIGDERAFGPVAAALRSDESEQVREAAAMSLGMLDGSRALRHLKRALKDENVFVRTAAEITIERIEIEE